MGVLLCSLACWVAAASAASATGAQAPGIAERAAQHLLHSPRLLELPGRPRDRLDLLGITLQLFSNHYLAWKPRGGADTDSTTGHSTSYDFLTRVDAEELAGWPGLTLLLHAKGQYEDSVNDDVGALSNPIDDADFDEGIYVTELWLEQSILEERLRLRAGFLEQQTIYDRNAYANNEDRQFLSTFLDNNPLVPLPNALGATLVMAPTSWLEVALGVADADNTPRNAGFDSAFDGVRSLNAYVEATVRTRIPQGERALPGALRVGFYHDGRRREVFGRSDAQGAPDTERGHLGAWLGFDQALYREPGRSEQGLGVFGRFGYADEKVSSVEWFWSVGGQYRGLLPGREEDILGVAAYHAIGSDRYRDRVESDFHDEAAVEIFYRVAALPWLSVTPDLQYVFDPGGVDGTRDAIVTVLRFRVTY